MVFLSLITWLWVFITSDPLPLHYIYCHRLTGELWDALRIFCVEKFKLKDQQTIAADAGVFNYLQLYFTNKNM
jgi:hypothetical protein